MKHTKETFIIHVIPKRRQPLCVILCIMYCATLVFAEDNGVSETPAMGWSTWSFLRSAPTESSVEAEALAMHNSGLQSHGFTYINIDDFYYLNPAASVDPYGRWVVDAGKFPDGMAGVANYVHGLGLKFGIYVTPGIPVAAYNQNTPIRGTSYHAQDIVTNTGTYEINYNYGNACMYYIDYSKPGAQAFIDSWANLFASWGVDYVKIDGVSDQDIPDVQAWSRALVQTGRPIHLELSNSLDVNNGTIWEQNANGWRIEGDIECYCGGSNSFPLTSWDKVSLRFGDAPKWTQFAGPGGWNDLDSLEIGNGTNGGLTSVERQSTMILWSICCAPLLLGSDLTSLDSTDLVMLMNDRVIQIDQAGSPGAPLTSNTSQVVWRAAESDGSYAVAFFNTASSNATISVTWAQLGLSGAADVQDLLFGSDLGVQPSGYSISVPSHGSTLYRISPAFPAFRYCAARGGNTIAGGATTTTASELSNGLKVGHVGMGGTLTFNNVAAPAAGSYNITFLYENGDATSRSAYISINGGTATAAAFNSSGSWTTLASYTITTTLLSGSNSIAISNPTGWAPDFDSLVVQSAAATVPSAPTGLAAIAGNTQVILNWNSIPGATGYGVKSSLTNGGSYSTIASIGYAGFTNTGLAIGTTYYYVVSATNSAGESIDSEQVSATTVAPPFALTVAPQNGGQFTLQFNGVDGQSYIVEMSTNVAERGWTPVFTNTQSGGVFVYTNTNMSNAARFYRVRR